MEGVFELSWGQDEQKSMEGLRGGEREWFHRGDGMHFFEPPEELVRPVRGRLCRSTRDRLNRKAFMPPPNKGRTGSEETGNATVGVTEAKANYALRV